ncbi:hypothetical protein KL905_002033 [Ogataea polymorpha]|nr:hypothetical protein KL937_001948 [Ogataea polymorpha]KAG7893839.1 hypothetical protein KL908_002893 [Ogataea polymorpha]KAG7901462.1 hypothetical protein KL935_002528 [Ogataea polymorpha]KAG7922011.1 hypothetical protein KL905_002033 [Ogataea polymorpha]KAG7936898.1 hypothetical protein KL904_002466 [Ogataea polymorpha]
MGFAAIGASSLGDTKTILMKKDERIGFKIEFRSTSTFTLETLDLVTSNGESERFDQPHMDLPKSQSILIEEILKVNENIILVSLSGTPVNLSWIDEIPALVHGWFNGMEFGNTMADVLSGDVNVSGKLSLSWPKQFKDKSSFLSFKSDKGKAVYGEDVFVGYRYYNRACRKPLFAFGHFAFGHKLSYTTFNFYGLDVKIAENLVLGCTLSIKNTGQLRGCCCTVVRHSPSDHYCSLLPVKRCSWNLAKRPQLPFPFLSSTPALFDVEKTKMID